LSGQNGVENEAKREIPDKDINQVFTNEHLRLLLNFAYPNIVSDEEALGNCLKDILKGDREKCLEYSSYLQEFADPIEVKSYRKVFLEKLKAL